MNRRRFWSALAGASGVPAAALATEPEKPKNWWDVELRDQDGLPTIDAGGILTPKLWNHVAKLAFRSIADRREPRVVLFCSNMLLSALLSYQKTILACSPTDPMLVYTGYGNMYLKLKAFQDWKIAAVAVDPENGKGLAIVTNVDDYATSPPLVRMINQSTGPVGFEWDEDDWRKL